MLNILLLLAITGFGISLYGYITEQKVKKDPSFKPSCDISDKISCSKAMLSPYANALFVSTLSRSLNPHDPYEQTFFFSTFALALLYYTGIAFLAVLSFTYTIFVAAITSCVVSCFFAYLLFFKVKTVCILCTSLYVVNFLMLFFAYKALYM